MEKIPVSFDQGIKDQLSQMRFGGKTFYGAHKIVGVRFTD